MTKMLELLEKNILKQPSYVWMSYYKHTWNSEK